MTWSGVEADISSFTNLRFAAVEVFGGCTSIVYFPQRDQAQEYANAHPVGSWAELYVPRDGPAKCIRPEFAKTENALAVAGVSLMSVGGALVILIYLTCLYEEKLLAYLYA